MKKIQIKILTMLFIAASMVNFSCSDVLDEEPRSIFEPGYFETEKGVQGGLTAMYSHLRYIYGRAYLYSTYEVGTDEYTWAQSGREGNFYDPDLSSVSQLTASTSRSDILWGQAFTNINTASGVIENATAVGVSPALVAEAYFFRAFDYFLLVQTFGGVPLDLGGGELKFNTAPSRKSVRNTVPEVYTKAIFPDLLKAVNDLPSTPRTTGTVAKTAARLFLAKAYLTYGWWLENPNGIPTYPETARTDPDGHNAQWYYQQAYTVATTAIGDPGPYGLQPTFYDVNLATNDRNNEILLYADHTESSAYYNEGSLTSGNEQGSDNCVNWMITWNYELIKSKASPSDVTGGATPVVRSQTQDLGRPWTRMAPTIGVFKKIFTDKTNDSRYDGTFTTAFRSNWSANSSDVLYNANDLPVHPGDPIITFLDEDDPAITYLVRNEAAADEPPTPGSVAINGAGGGVLPGRSDYVVGPSGISRYKYPGVWKLGPYRTSGLLERNAPSLRPFPIAKFSELYLIAAEAAVKTDNNTAAKDLVNVLRTRAGKWRWNNNANVAKNEDHSAELVAATPAQITINYILEERGRELFAEGYRWFDLVRTQKWNELASTYEICGINPYDHTPETITRTIEPKHYLRPIPQTQLDGLEMTDSEKAQYQNPGY